MKKIINIERRPVIIDTETFNAKVIDRSTRGIDEIYVVPEDAHLEWTSALHPHNVTEVDVKKDDIIVTFYNKDLGADFIIVNSEDWLKALDNAKAADQKRKEEWAAKQKESAHVNAACEDCGDYCGDNCGPC